MKKTLLATIGFASAILVPSQAAAHIAYLNITNQSPTVSGETKTYSGNDVFAGNFGWADAADASWGNSHHGGWVRFLLGEQSLVNITVTRDPATQYITLGNNTFLYKLGDLTPAFSIYSGVLPDESHDGALPVPPGKDGAWNAFGDVTMSNEDVTSTIEYLAHAGSVGSLATSVAWSGVLGPGLYTVAIGGTCDTQACRNDNTVYRGFQMTLSTTPVPLPGAAWLMFSALAGFAAVRRRAIA